MHHPVLQLILERTRDGSSRMKRSDPYHLALVVECGGMRGVAAGGILRELGDSRIFDSFHGSSAGACAATYFATNQIDAGQSIYLKDICNRDVVNPFRPFSHPCMVDTDFIGDVVIGQRRAVDIDKISGSDGILNVVTTAVGSGEPIVHSNFNSKSELITALKATLRVPGLREPGIAIADDHHIDGGVVAPIPVFSAFRKGATHVLIVGTQRLSDYGQHNSRISLEANILKLRYGAKIASAYRAANEIIGSELYRSYSHAASCVLLARPPHSPYCAWHTIDIPTLTEVEADGRGAAKLFLSGSHESAEVSLNVASQ